MFGSLFCEERIINERQFIFGKEAECLILPGYCRTYYKKDIDSELAVLLKIKIWGVNTDF